MSGPVEMMLCSVVLRIVSIRRSFRAEIANEHITGQKFPLLARHSAGREGLYVPEHDLV